MPRLGHFDCLYFTPSCKVATKLMTILQIRKQRLSEVM